MFGTMPEVRSFGSCGAAWAAFEAESRRIINEERQRFNEIYNAPERIRARQKQNRRFTERAVAVYGRHLEKRSRIVPGRRPAVKVRAHRRPVRSRFAFARASSGGGDDGNDCSPDLPAPKYSLPKNSHKFFSRITTTIHAPAGSFTALGVLSC